MAAMTGAVFVNPSAGSQLSCGELSDLFAGHRVLECPGDQIAERVADALRESTPDFEGARLKTKRARPTRASAATNGGL